MHRRNGIGCFATLIIIIAIIVFLLANIVKGSAQAINSFTDHTHDDSRNTITREKINTDNPYLSDCIIDEIGWFDNISKTGISLETFWRATGVQPYIILRAYDPDLTTDAQKEQWAMDYYAEHFTTENIFLYVYFGEADTDNDVGYMCYANGRRTSSVMDSEAVEIFWNYIDQYWYTDLSTDDVFIKVFSETASTIMNM